MPKQTHFERQLKEWFDNEQNIGRYKEGIALLEASGIFPLLQRNGIPALHYLGSDKNVMASQASWSNGYQSALENLRDFITQFEPQDTNKMQEAVGSPDFGGDALALQRGDLTKDEVKK